MISRDFFSFFVELERNNTREWFHAHSKEFQAYVKAPFMSLVEEVLTLLRAEDPLITMSASDAVFRIHRDVRFSKNKDPYKTAMGASINRGGRKDMSDPGLYFEINARGGHVAGGIYMPSKEQLADIRAWIADHYAEFEEALKAPAFVKAFGELRGERNKVLPSDFKDVAKQMPLIANKQFYYWGDIAAGDLMAADAAQRIMDMHQAAAPVRDILRRALQGV
jgi:uncharacterized protein (TIGR02453 family)